MSDSDDTDALLLVPPDFFYIHSDSEDNLFCDVSREQNSDIERMVVNNLIDHVSELENRVQIIEHKDSLNSYYSDRSFYSQYKDHSVYPLHDLDSLDLFPYSHRYSGSCENIKNYCTVRHSDVNVSLTPVKNRLPASLPSTPSGGCNTFQYQPSQCPIQPDNLVKQHRSEEVNPGEVTTITMQPVAQTEGTVVVNSAVKEHTGVNYIQNSASPLKNNQGQDLMNEIDEFLDSIKKKQPEEAPENNLSVSSGAGYHGPKYFESVSFPFFVHSRTLPGTRQYGLNAEMRGLALSDVSTLLDEMETTQTEIMHKLHEAKKPLPGKSLLLQTSVNTNKSVPKLDSNESSSETQSNFLVSVVEGKVNESTSNHLETSCQQTDCSITSSEDVSNTYHKSVFNRSGMKSARRKLDLGCETSVSPHVATKTGEGSNRVVVVEPLASLSNTTITSSLSSAASNSQVPSVIDNTLAPDKQGSTRDLPQCASHLLNYSHVLQDDQGVVVRTNGESAFSTHTYPPPTSRRPVGSVASSSQEYGVRLGVLPTVPLCVPDEVLHERLGTANQKLMDSLGTTKAFLNSGNNSAASGDHIRRDPLKFGHENDPVTTLRAVQGSGNLLSLSELWSSEELSGVHKDDVANPTRKLEEERYRRQHCERLIQQLQGRLLEEQQKVAVAVEVDQAKDRAILQLQAGWRQLVGHWHGLEEQRHSVANTLHLERESFQRDLAQSSQKVRHLERELSKMLGLAQDYREKNEAVSRESEESKRKHQMELQEAVTRANQVEQALSSASEALKDARVKEEELTGQLLSVEQQIDKEKQAKEVVFKEMEQLRDILSRLEAELLAIKEEKTSLQLKLKEEKNRNSLLDKQKKALQASLDDLKKKEKVGREEARVAGEKLERAKLELRDHYQQQVEKVVQEKMREFQAQLDADEASMRSELQQRERAITELAAQQIKQIADKHEMEIQLLGEKHQEEQQLLRLQLSQCAQKVTDLQAALTQLRSHRGQLAERLHAIMEAQWRESVRIIAGGSPLHPSKSGASDQAWEVPSLPLHRLERSGSSSTMDSAPFGQEGQVTFRVKANQSQQLTAAQQTESQDELKKYIAMLLDCKPGNPVGDLSEIPTSECGLIPARAQLEYLGAKLDSQEDRFVMQGQADHADLAQLAARGLSRENLTGKPPWK